jgi:hypothetical protein
MGSSFVKTVNSGGRPLTPVLKWAVAADTAIIQELVGIDKGNTVV